MALLMSGCDAAPQENQVPKGKVASVGEMDFEAWAPEEWLDLPSSDKCFGIPNDFFGGLSYEQEQLVPDAMRGVYCIESVTRITEAKLSKKPQSKNPVAEEEHDGRRFVALSGFVCIGMEDGSEALMSTIERYEIVPE